MMTTTIDETHRHGRGTLPRLCATGVAVCLATGPSLALEDVDYCRGKATVIAINDAWRLAPWADVLYSSDRKWFPYHRWVPDFHGLKVSTDLVCRPHEAIAHGLVLLRYTGDTGIDWDPNALRGARNSGGAALNLAPHLGATRIILLGYDMAASAGRRHFFGNHPEGLHRRQPFDIFTEYIGTMAAPLAECGIEVVNCSRASALTCFQRRPLREVLS
jgi:hypothetical protein